MRSAGLNSSSIFLNKCLAGRGEVCARKFLKFTFDSLNHWDAKEISIGICIYVQNFEHKFLTFLFAFVGSMAFLPQELSGSDERSRMFELPPNNIGPLVG